jgi:hypothetical protein
MKTVFATFFSAISAVQTAFVYASLIGKHQHMMRNAFMACAALFFMSMSIQPAHAQATVAPSCPSGYVFSGNQCVRSTAPVPSCPSSFLLSQGQCIKSASAAPVSQSGTWVFIVRKSLGIKNATELDGAVVCLVSGSPSEAEVNGYFQTRQMKFEPLTQDSIHEAVSSYDRGACDVLVEKNQAANNRINDLRRAAEHLILPDQIGGSSVSSPPPVRRAAPAPPLVRRAAPAPAPPVNLAYPLQSELKRLGCLTGRIDGVWGGGSRAALNRFSNQKGLRLGNQPSQAALDEARRTNSGYCRTVRAAPQPPRASNSCQATFNTCVSAARRNGHPREKFELEEDCKTQFAACSGNRPASNPGPVTKKLRCSKIKYAFTRGNTCACSGGRIFSGSACVKQHQQASPQQCVKRCEAIGAQCDRKLTQLGDAKGWDGDLRRDYWEDNCAPKVNSCKVGCNSKGPMRPGECRFMADGEQVCS